MYCNFDHPYTPTDAHNLYKIKNHTSSTHIKPPTCFSNKMPFSGRHKDIQNQHIQFPYTVLKAKCQK